MLLALEMSSPFFGWWHGFSLCLGIGTSFLYGGLLHYYSTRVIRNIYLKSDGETVRIEFYNAFFASKEETYKIQDLGYLEPSRVYNLHLAKHKSTTKMYVNIKRNMYKHPEYQEIIKQVFIGKVLTFPQSQIRAKIRR